MILAITYNCTINTTIKCSRGFKMFPLTPLQLVTSGKYYLPSPWVQLLSRSVVILTLIHVHCFLQLDVLPSWCPQSLYTAVGWWLSSSGLRFVMLLPEAFEHMSYFWNTCSFNLNKYLQQRKIEISMCSPSWMLDCFPNYFTTVSRNCMVCQHCLLSFF